jgi:hypothetical protein
MFGHSAIRHMPRAVMAAALLVLAAGTAAASSLPEPVLRGTTPLEKVGGGQLTWLGMPIYDASLWTTSGRFTGFGPGETVALSLWYRRSFSRDQLLSITATAWRKLDPESTARHREWLAELHELWSDVAPGHNVTAVVEPGRATRFYDQRRMVGQIDDPAFGPAFLSIWLDPRSVVGDLRAQLIGAAP